MGRKLPGCPTSRILRTLFIPPCPTVHGRSWKCAADGIKITNQTDMANTFNTFFTNIGAKLANEISYSGEKGYAYYLRNKLDFKFSLNDVDESIVMS